MSDDILPAAIELDQLLRELPGLTLDPEPNIVAGRAIKSPGELDLLRRAARCTPMPR
ncbi:MAG: hypothetical protein R2848_11995 [Thermomicrobiales bacterium]